MTDTYVLDAAGNPRPEPDTRKWREAFADRERRTVARDSVGDAEVSTVFLGLDHGYGDGPPILWETMIFWPGHELDGEQDRYTSRAAAVAGHAAMVARVRAAQSMPAPAPATMRDVNADELAVRYRVEVWAEYLGRWIPADIEGPYLASVLDDVRMVLCADPEDDPDNRRIVECRETVIPWPEGAPDAQS